MQSNSTVLKDFSGQNIYVGLDVHDKSWKVHVYSDEFELRSFCQEPAFVAIGYSGLLRRKE